MKALLFLVCLASAAEPVAHPSWAKVLERFVDDQGRVDFAAIRNDPAPLRQQVEFVDKGTQAAYPDSAQRLAFLINAYNALAMNHAAHSGTLPESKVRFFYWGSHEVAGKNMSLHALENKVIRPLGEPRVHFALNCMVRGCPRLPREPFTAERLQAQLNVAAQEFFNSPKHVQVDAAAKTVRYSSILKWYKEDFLAEAPSLTAYANRYRDQKIPEDFKVEFLPYDWTLNAP